MPGACPAVCNTLMIRLTEVDVITIVKNVGRETSKELISIHIISAGASQLTITISLICSMERGICSASVARPYIKISNIAPSIWSQWIGSNCNDWLVR